MNNWLKKWFFWFGCICELAESWFVYKRSIGKIVCFCFDLQSNNFRGKCAFHIEMKINTLNIARNAAPYRKTESVCFSSIYHIILWINFVWSDESVVLIPGSRFVRIFLLFRFFFLHFVPSKYERNEASPLLWLTKIYSEPPLIKHII